MTKKKKWKVTPKYKTFGGVSFTLEAVYDTKEDAKKEAKYYRKHKTPYNIIPVVDRGEKKHALYFNDGYKY